MNAQVNILESEGIVKTYRIPDQKPISVLNGISFSVARGEHVAIVGRSGAGKTTLLNVLGGLDVPSAGDVRIAGKSLFRGFGAARRRNQLRAEKIGFVFQGYHLMPELDIVENVMLPMAAQGGLNPFDVTCRKRAEELIARVGLLDRRNHLPAELSGGEQQRVALARALMGKPKIVFADEPTGNLDKLTGSEILKMLFEIGGDSLAVVMVTHSQDAAAACTRILRLVDGQVESVSSGMLNDATLSHP